jgi:hypothetical protein
MFSIGKPEESGSATARTAVYLRLVPKYELHTDMEAGNQATSLGSQPPDCWVLLSFPSQFTHASLDGPPFQGVRDRKSQESRAAETPRVQCGEINTGVWEK